MIRVLVCDDQTVVREGLKAILESDPRFQVAGTAKNGCEALELCLVSLPDVVLMDLQMPVVDGVAATRSIRQELPNTKILVLTTFDAEDWLFDAIRSGASGYLLKESPREALFQAVVDVHEGRNPVDPSIAGKLFPPAAMAVPASPDHRINGLSSREREILSLIGEGLSNRQIAQRIFLSEGTVRNYVSSLLEKLGLEDRTQAAIFAVRSGV